jgi:hypothetical protein
MGMIDYSWRWRRRRRRQSCQEQGMSHPIDGILVLHPQPALANGLSCLQATGALPPLPAACYGRSRLVLHTLPPCLAHVFSVSLSQLQAGREPLAG